MNESFNTTTNGQNNFQEHFSYWNFYTSFDGQVAHVAVEILLILGTIWIMLKKKKPPIDLDLSEEEALIAGYSPESLVPEVSPSHHALNPRVLQGKAELNIKINGVESLNFASHDYLGFIGDTHIENKAKRCIDVYGVGSCGPRGFYGTTVLHIQLEQLLAQFLGTEDTILFSYGFATIASTIPAYAKKNDIVFVDEKCNFAIQQGLRASKSEIKYFKHNDVRDLENILEDTRTNDLVNVRKARKSRRHLVVEGIYFNTGQICDLPNLIKLCKKYKLRIFVDESISLGVLGNTGRGVTEYFQVPRGDVDLVMGSCEFALASIGGFCAGSRFLVDHLQAAALGYMFSASLPPVLIEASIDALEEIKTHPEKLEKLKELSSYMYTKLRASTVLNEHFTISGDRPSPVHVLTLRPEHAAQKGDVIEGIVCFCLKHNIVVARAALLPDADVTVSSPSLRLTININHTDYLVSYLIYILEEACFDAFNYTPF